MDPSIYRLRQQDILTFCVLALLCLGAIMVQSAAMNVTGKLTAQWTPMGTKQAGFCVVGLLAYLIIGRLDYTPLGRVISKSNWIWHPVLWMLLVTLALNVLVLVPHVGITKNGAQRW